MGRRVAWVVSLCLGAGHFLSSTAQGAWFVRGDVNQSGDLTVTDAIQLFRFLFGGDPGAVRCLDAADIDDDGSPGVTDGINLISHLFLGGPGPQTVVRGCWFDATEDLLGCESFEPCNPVGIFFVGDRSGTMREGGAFPLLKREILGAISQLSAGDQFAIVLFDSHVVRFPVSGLPADASPAMKSAAIAFVMSSQTGSGTCAKPAFVASLSQAAGSTTRARVIHYLSDGDNTCLGQNPLAYGEEILADLPVQNVDRIPVNAVCLGSGSSVDEAWMKRLAGETGGSYVRIP